MMKKLTLNQFNYTYPDKLIAQFPLKKRDQARLMVVHRNSQTIVHDRFFNVGKYLPAASKIVLNDSRVIPARLLGRRDSGGRVEIFVLNQKEKNQTYEVLLRPLRRLKVNEKIHFNGNSLVAEIKDKENRLVQFNRKDVKKHLKRLGHIPLPPYIKRDDQPIDRSFYQTVYAKKEGSVASPTAGLHFTKSLINQLKNQGHSFHKVTLNINYATFKPVEERDITQHKMHTEEYSIAQQAWNSLQSAKRKGKKIVAVGTTSTRVLETMAKSPKHAGETNLFIYPGFSFKMVDILITNFHLPLSTLLMLVYAFGGEQLMKKAYKEAIDKKYRLFSYGDCMIII